MFVSQEDPLDAYTELLAAENRTNDELLRPGDDFALPENLPSYLEHAAFRYEADRQRYEAGQETEAG